MKEAQEALPQDNGRAIGEVESFVLRTELLNRLKGISQAIKDRVRRLIETENQPQASEAKAEQT